jgi:hypothetical protein
MGKDMGVFPELTLGGEPIDDDDEEEDTRY